MPAELASILKIEVPVMVQIASRQMTVREVSNLAPGAIIELPKLANEELEVMVSNRTIGAGMAVKVGENFGVRVTYVGDLKQRIRALAAAASKAAGPAPAEPAQTGEPDEVEATGP
jgi:flagellar motor switch protein FliN